MGRPRRSQGRPDTPVIPDDWGRSHAPVAARTRRGRCTITVGGSAAPVYDATKGHSVTVDPEPIYDGPCRVQVSATQETQQSTGDATVLVQTYLVSVDYDAVIPLGAVVRVTAADDTDLIGRALVVRAAAKGTERFERDLTCTEDATAPATATED